MDYITKYKMNRHMYVGIIVIIKVAVKQFAHAINCFINTAETKPYIMLNHRYSVNNSGSQ